MIATAERKDTMVVWFFLFTHCMETFWAIKFVVKTQRHTITAIHDNLAME